MKKGIVAALLAFLGLSLVAVSVQASPYEYGEYGVRKAYKYGKYDDDGYEYRYRRPVSKDRKLRRRCWDDDCYKYSRRYLDHERREHRYKLNYRYRHYEDD
jgi:hypothetical protein